MFLNNELSFHVKWYLKADWWRSPFRPSTSPSCPSSCTLCEPDAAGSPEGTEKSQRWVKIIQWWTEGKMDNWSVPLCSQMKATERRGCATDDWMGAVGGVEREPVLSMFAWALCVCACTLNRKRCDKKWGTGDSDGERQDRSLGDGELFPCLRRNVSHVHPYTALFVMIHLGLW